MYRKNFSIRRVPEVIAHSGSVLLHFFSDDAYNMSGFNISYKLNGCPTTDSSLDCSGNGVCDDLGGCTCNAEYMGSACHVPKCPNNCAADWGHGHCDWEKHRCACKSGYAGADCMQIAALGYWDTIAQQYQLPNGSASHGSAVWRDTLHIIGGERYGRGDLLHTYDFNGNVWETVHTSSIHEPEMRYGASTVFYGDKVFMYGGVVGKHGVTDELWAFDVSAKTWENITVKSAPCNSTLEMCGPLRSAGHTATLVPGLDAATNTEYKNMVVIFGHSPEYGYLNTVQEYSFSTRVWSIVKTRGHPVKGGYGHTADYDPLTEKIYVYGGILSENENTQMISGHLYSYHPATKTWKLLTAASTGRFLHTANFVSPGLMMVFGGNTHNDTSHSFGAKCYSNDLLVYDVLCDSWHIQSMPNNLRADLSRFGHSAKLFDGSMYIYGGFDGQMLSDMLKYTPGTCHQFQKASECLSNRPGLKCIWDLSQTRCIDVAHIPKEHIFARDQAQYRVCPEEGRIVMTQQLLLDGARCGELNDCNSCLSTSYGCTYCGNGICSKDKCRESHLDGFSTNAITPLTTLEKCNEDLDGLQCAQLHDCRACLTNRHCHWDFEQSKCRILGNRTGEDQLPCPPSCSTLTSCGNCTNEECIWCQNEERCVDKNAYTASFPYGQCREWTTLPGKCRVSASGGWSSSQCSYYKTCSLCRDDPACGWCDDGSMTGMGECLPGGDSGPQWEMQCSNHRWYFTHCPDCQCNGHSRCLDGRTCQQPCANLTTGKHCNHC